jgi:hypothetical protein
MMSRYGRITAISAGRLVAPALRMRYRAGDEGMEVLALTNLALQAQFATSQGVPVPPPRLGIMYVCLSWPSASRQR